MGADELEAIVPAVAADGYYRGRGGLFDAWQKADATQDLASAVPANARVEPSELRN